MSKRRSEVVPAPKGISNYVAKQWEKGATNQNYVLVDVKQIRPGDDVQEDFEVRRTELEQQMLSHLQKLTTLQLWCSVAENMIEPILEKGFQGAMKGSSLSFSEDPCVIIKEGHPESHHLFLCRVALGLEGPDYKNLRGKYILQNLRPVLPAFIVSWSFPEQEQETLEALAEPNYRLEARFPPAGGPRAPPPAAKSGGAKFCPQFGSQLATGQCGAKPGDRFCILCGNALYYYPPP